MAFNRVPSKVPSDIGRVTVSFATMKPTDTDIVSGSLSFDVVDAAGVVVDTQTYDILPNMNAAQKTAIFNFLTAIRAKAKAEAV